MQVLICFICAKKVSDKTESSHRIGSHFKPEKVFSSVSFPFIPFIQYMSNTHFCQSLSATFDGPEVFLSITWFTAPYKPIQLPSNGWVVSPKINPSNIHILILQNMILSNIFWRKSNSQPGSISWLSTFYVIFALSIEISRRNVSYFCICEIEFVSWEKHDNEINWLQREY